jgi:hypothetical protein
MTIVERLGEPKGWRRLQTMAQKETDAQRLESIIDQMNRLLDRHEKRAGNRELSASRSRGRSFDECSVLSMELEA